MTHCRYKLFSYLGRISHIADLSKTCPSIVAAGSSMIANVIGHLQLSGSTYLFPIVSMEIQLDVPIGIVSISSS